MPNANCFCSFFALKCCRRTECNLRRMKTIFVQERPSKKSVGLLKEFSGMTWFVKTEQKEIPSIIVLSIQNGKIKKRSYFGLVNPFSIGVFSITTFTSIRTQSRLCNPNGVIWVNVKSRVIPIDHAY